jgi:dolichol-phosphate mannosyltransferase
VISIVIATYNEVDNIEKMINLIFHYIPSPVEIIVVDDNSPDGTWKKVEDMHHPSVILIRRMQDRGLASALLRGIMESSGDIIGWWDCDMLMCPELAPKMLAALESHDIVIGSRYVTGARDERDFVRRWASKAVNGIASLVLGHGIKDYDSGVILLKRNVFDLCLPIPTGFGEYFIEFIYCCSIRKASIIEIPYIMTDRIEGLSKASYSVPKFIIMGLRYIARIIIARVRER